MRRLASYLLLIMMCMAQNLRAEGVLVFAASSLQTALDENAQNWRDETGHEVSISYGGSGQLARQIVLGAPADIYISAAPEWMDEVEAEGLLAKDTRRDLLGNSLVLISHNLDAPKLTINDDLDMVGFLQGHTLAIASVDAVPAGRYAKESLEHLGAWDALKTEVVQTDNVRSALALVARGEADYGIVYQSDALAEPKVKAIGEFPEDTHSEILYPLAILREAQSPFAREFYDYLTSNRARDVFEANGFMPLEGS